MCKTHNHTKRKRKMSEYPECYQEKSRRARKEHKCCECQSKINPGDRYKYISGVWNRRGQSFKLCLECHTIRGIVSSLADEFHFDPTEDGPAFGDLHQWIGEFGEEGGNEMVDAITISKSKVTLE